MKRILSLAVVALLVLCSQGFAAQATATFGDYNSSNVYRMTADINGVITFAQDTGVLFPYVSTATTNTTLTAAQTGSTIVFNNGSGTAQSGTTYILPTAAVGMQFSFIADVAKWFRIDSVSTDTFQYSTAVAGSALNNSGSALAGDNITIFCATANKWSIKSKVGTWTVDNNP